MITGVRDLRDTVDPRVLPQTATKALALEGYAATVGIVFGYPDFSGWRSLADTTKLIQWRNEAVARGEPSYRVAPYGSGYHGKGAAFDIRITKVPAGRTLSWGYATLGAYAPRIGLRWGGTFSAPADIFHFELAIPLVDAQRMFDQWQSSQHNAGVESHPEAVSTFKSAAAPLTKAVEQIVKASATPTGAIEAGLLVGLLVAGIGFFTIGLFVANVVR